MIPQIIKHPKTESKSFGFNSRGFYTPYYMKIKNKEYFIINLIERTLFAPKQDKQQRTEAAERLLNLRKNGYKFLKFYCPVADNPLDFLNFIKENYYTIQRHGEIFLDCEDLGFTEFHGNLIELSCAFNFRIYDNKLIQQLKSAIKNVKIEIHY